MIGDVNSILTIFQEEIEMEYLKKINWQISVLSDLCKNIRKDIFVTSFSADLLLFSDLKNTINVDVNCFIQ